MKKTPASKIAFGGVMAALALVIMNMVGLIPIATYVCPSLSIILLSVVLRLCGRRIGWAWYGAVAILSVLMAPDKEAAAIFVVLGYYPMIKPVFEKTKMPNLCKYLFFNSVILAVYWLLINLMGLTEIAVEFKELGVLFTIVTLLMGNMVFQLLDKILTRISVMDKWGRK
jgi:hypothetical protein